MPRQHDYAKIAIACKELGIDRSQLLSDRYGIDSAKKLTSGQMSDLYRHFHALGWRVKRTKRSTSSPVYVDRQQRKVVALWITLARAGVINNSSDQALQRYVKRMTGVDNLKWCSGDDRSRLIEALKQWGLREGVDLG